MQERIHDIIELKLLVANQQATIDVLSSNLHTLELATRQLRANDEANASELEEANRLLASRLDESRERETLLKRELSSMMMMSSSSGNRDDDDLVAAHRIIRSQQRNYDERRRNSGDDSDINRSGGGDEEAEEGLRERNRGLEAENADLMRQLRELREQILNGDCHNRDSPTTTITVPSMENGDSTANTM